MKITIYELLGMIKDGKAPKKIKFKDTIYEFWKDDEEIDYRFKDEDDCYGYLSSYIGNNYLDSIYEEVEILEEEKKIPEKLELPSFNEFKTMTTAERYTITAKEYDVLNDIIDYLKSKGE